jgi:phosphatidylethanolamine/phosphatidyl-N-methylethanolamine N-methyltransferase
VAEAPCHQTHESSDDPIPRRIHTDPSTLTIGTLEVKKTNSWLFLKRFIKQPTKVASVIPSSPFLINHVSRKFDFSRPGVIVEFGPGEGCHTREILRRMHPQSKLILFELDEALALHLKSQFAADSRVEVIHQNASALSNELSRRGLTHCDHILSGIPFSILEKTTKRRLLQEVYDCLAPDGRFIIYQVTNELLRHATAFPRADTEHCMLNIPPMFVIVFHKDGEAAEAEVAVNGRMSHEESFV